MESDMTTDKNLLTVQQAVDLAERMELHVPGRTIRWAAMNEFIPGAEKFGRDWMIPRETFIHWLSHRPKPGRKTTMSEILTIENDGAEIVATNFFQSDLARRGGYYLSTNAGAFRLLVPKILESAIPEFRTAKHVIVSRGPWPEKRQENAIEILFDDRTDEPFSIHLGGAAQVDRYPPRSDAGQWFAFTAWTEGPKCAYRTRCYFRFVPRIPCLEGLPPQE